ncbi:MAG: zinc ribbon domain-containing protein [Promethearchaeota archaeon]
MSNLECYYHPDRTAATKCEKCGRLICLECRMIHRERVIVTTDDTQFVRYEYCPDCMPKKTEESQTYPGFGGVILVFIIAVPLIMFAGSLIFIAIGATWAIRLITDLLGISLSFFPDDILLFVFMYFFIGLVMISSLILTYRRNRRKETTCHQCGAKIESNSNTCLVCGIPRKKGGLIRFTAEDGSTQGPEWLGWLFILPFITIPFILGSILLGIIAGGITGIIASIAPLIGISLAYRDQEIIFLILFTSAVSILSIFLIGIYRRYQRIATTCPQCGAKVEPESEICSVCGAELKLLKSNQNLNLLDQED